MACEFSEFRRTFLSAACALRPGLAAPERTSEGASTSHGSPLEALDLRHLRRDDAPSEMAQRRERLAHFDKQCSRVLDGLFVGSEGIARSWDALQQHGITHVINCVGSLYPAQFAGKLQYLTLFLKGALQLPRRGGGRRTRHTLTVGLARRRTARGHPLCAGRLPAVH